MAQLTPSEFTMALIEALRDATVIATLNQAIDRDAISNSVSVEVGKHIKDLKNQLAVKNQEIAELKKKYSDLEVKCDALEQYTRKRSLRIDGMPEQPDENSHEVVLDVCNNVLQLQPPVLLQDIDNSHRLNPVAPRADGRPRTLLVKFTNYRVRQRILQARGRLKQVNACKQYQRPQPAPAEPPAGADDDVTSDAAVTEPGAPPGAQASRPDAADGMAPPSTQAPDVEPPAADQACPPARRYVTIPLPHPIFLNEDLSRARSLLSFDARKLKRDGKIEDTWVFDGRIKVKTNNKVVVNIDRKEELDKFR